MRTLNLIGEGAGGGGGWGRALEGDTQCPATCSALQLWGEGKSPGIPSTAWRELREAAGHRLPEQRGR